MSAKVPPRFFQRCLARCPARYVTRRRACLARHPARYLKRYLTRCLIRWSKLYKMPSQVAFARCLRKGAARCLASCLARSYRALRKANKKISCQVPSEVPDTMP